MSQQQSLSHLLSRAFDDPDFLQSIKAHKRYHLRLLAIISIDLGLFFNILAVCLARDKILNGLAFLPVCLSRLYELLSQRLS